MFRQTCVLFALVLCSSVRDAVGLEQDCPRNIFLFSQDYICPNDTSNTRCNISPAFTEQYTLVEDATEGIHLFERCGGSRRSKCIGPRPDGRIEYVAADFGKPDLPEAVASNYLRVAFNILEAGTQPDFQLSWSFNDVAGTGTVLKVADALTCGDKNDMSASSFLMYMPMNTLSTTSEVYKLRISADSTIAPWTGSFQVQSGVLISGPPLTDFIKAAGTLITIGSVTNGITDRFVLPLPITEPLTPQPTPTALRTPTAAPKTPSSKASDDGMTTVVAVSIGSLFVLGAAALFMVRRKRFAEYARTLGSQVSHYRLSASEENIKKRISDSPLYREPQHDNNQLQYATAVVGTIRKAPPLGSRKARAKPSFEINNGAHKSAGVMHSQQRLELQEFLRLRDPKLTSNVQLHAKVAKLSQYQRTDLIRALVTLYGEVPPSMENDRVKLGI